MSPISIATDCRRSNCVKPAQTALTFAAGHNFHAILAREHRTIGLRDWAFTVRRLQRVTATCRPENVGSARVLEKAGLRLEGRMRDHMWIRGRYRDSLLYAALRTDPR